MKTPPTPSETRPLVQTAPALTLKANDLNENHINLLQKSHVIPPKSHKKLRTGWYYLMIKGEKRDYKPILPILQHVSAPCRNQHIAGWLSWTEWVIRARWGAAETLRDQTTHSCPPLRRPARLAHQHPCSDLLLSLRGAERTVKDREFLMRQGSMKCQHWTMKTHKMTQIYGAGPVLHLQRDKLSFCSALSKNCSNLWL